MAKFHNCVAVQFDSTATYKLGEHVMYNDMLYKCIVDDYSAGEFSLDNFEQTYLADAVNVGNVMDENIAPVYDSALTYALGEYVLYNTELYVCTEPVTTAEPFDSEKWERTYVSDVVEGKSVTTGYLEYIANEYNESTTYEIGEAVIYDGCMYECLESTTGEFNETMWKRTYISENVLRDTDALNSNLMSIFDDLTKIDTLANINSWTATTNCYVFGLLNTSSGGTINVYVNDVLKFSASNGSNNAVYLYMEQGDILTMSRNDANATSMILNAFEKQ